MSEKKYPEEIYPKRKTEKTAFGFMESWHSSNLDYERAYDLGFRDGRFKERLEASNPLAGWSNLTAAIQAGARIDWEKLEGVEARCVHPELGALTHRMERDSAYPPEEYVGWDEEASFAVWSEAFYSAWYGRNGWSLWVKGDLPLRKQTADELAPGTCFTGKHPDVHDGVALNCIVVEQPNSMPKMVIYTNPITNQRASEVEVVKVYGVGTFKTPEGDA